MVEAKKHERAEALKKFKELCKEFGFTAKMLNSSLTEGIKNKKKIEYSIYIISIFALCLSMIFGMYTAKSDIPPYTWINQLRYFLQGKSNSIFSDIKWSKIDQNVILIKGLPGFLEDGDLSRLPNRISSNLREPLRRLERNTAGGVASFITSSRNLKISALIESSKPGHMTDIMSAGVDVYENGNYLESFYSKRGILNEELILQTEGIKTIDVYLPLYGNVNEINFFDEGGSKSNSPVRHKNVILYYGSSITQGCCASNPAMSFPAIVSRLLDVEQINLGFSGNGLGDLEIAEYIVELNPSIVVLDYWANPSVEFYDETLPVFIGKIRSKLVDTPIVVTSTFANPGREDAQRNKDEISTRTVEHLRSRGDDNIYYADGLLNEDEIDGLVDARHLNSYGFHLVADRLSNFITVNNLLEINPNE
ncbi:MAG: SGNH/GDSL hydrolase family protein [Geminicoccaceae bacterium]